MKKNTIAFRVTGRYALFSDPVTRVGGEKCTYSIPTYQALKGICESIYWKPSIIWVVDKCRIINRIKTESKGIRVPNYVDRKKNDLSVYTYLKDVEYRVQAHFEWNENRPELAEDRDEKKHYLIAKRMLARGGRRDIFLGTRECQGYVEPCLFDEGSGAYDKKGNEDLTVSFGIMVHGITYPDESGTNEMKTRLWDARMYNGVIDFIRPDECTMWMDTGNYQIKSFVPEKNFSGLSEFKEEGDTDGMDDAIISDV